MYFLIAIVFIAELIITATIINFIQKADKAVLKANADVLNSREKIIKAMHGFKKNVHTLEKGVNFLICYVNRKREEYLLKIIKSILIYALIFIIETRFTKFRKVRKFANGVKTFLRRLLAL